MAKYTGSNRTQEVGGSSPPSSTFGSPPCAGIRCFRASSAVAVDGDLERRADLTHAVVAESAESLEERSEGNALDGIEIDDRDERDRVVRRLEEDLGLDPADRGRARSDQCTPQT